MRHEKKQKIELGPDMDKAEKEMREQETRNRRARTVSKKVNEAAGEKATKEKRERETPF